MILVPVTLSLDPNIPKGWFAEPKELKRKTFNGEQWIRRKFYRPFGSGLSRYGEYTFAEEDITFGKPITYTGSIQYD